MTEQFDITSKPLSVPELERQREALSAQIEAYKRQARLPIWTFVALVNVLLAAAIAGNALWGWLSWSDFFGVVGVAATGWFGRQQHRIEQARTALAALADADRAVCLEIRDWLTDETIRQYRDWVQAEGRLFTVGEVEAMRAHWDARDKRQTEAERAAAIEAACREVYVDSLIKS